MLELALNQIEVSVVALALAIAVALPIGLYFGHKGHRANRSRSGIGNASRAVPSWR